jgi:hypothetical protein
MLSFLSSLALTTTLTEIPSGLEVAKVSGLWQNKQKKCVVEEIMELVERCKGIVGLGSGMHMCATGQANLLLICFGGSLVVLLPIVVVVCRKNHRKCNFIIFLPLSDYSRSSMALSSEG